MRISVAKKGFDYRTITKSNLNDFVSKTPTKNRDKILSFLKQSDKNSIVSPRVYRDPINGRIAVSPVETHEIDGCVWSNITTYLFERYNIELNEEFVSKFN